MGGPYRGSLLEFGDLCLLTFQKWGKALGIPRQNWRATSQTSIWSELTKELHTSEAYDDSPSTAGQKKTSVQLSKHHRSRSRRQWTFLLQLNLPHAPPKVPEDEKQEPTAEPEEDEEMQGEPLDTKEKPGVSSSSGDEKRTETQEMSVKKRVMMKSPKRPATPVSPPDGPAKRRPLKKTDLKSDDVLMPVVIEDTDLLHTVNALLNDETGEEAKPRSEESERTKILTVLDDPKEVE